MHKRIGILGDIGAGKSLIAKQFGFPVFNADEVVNKIYKKNKFCYKKLRKKLHKYIKSYPINKTELSKAIISNKKNLKIIVNVVHPIVRKEMNLFLKRHKNHKIVILDIPLLLENKINQKNDILVYVDSPKSDILIRLKKRKNFNQKLLKKFKTIQLPTSFKRKKSHFIIKNDFTKKSVNIGIKNILNELNK